MLAFLIVLVIIAWLGKEYSDAKENIRRQKTFYDAMRIDMKNHPENY